MTNDTRRTRIYWAVGSVLIIIYTLIPVVWMISLSLKSSDTITDKSLIPTAPTLANYTQIFEIDLFTSSLINSVGIALLSTFFAVALATLAAYAIARLDFPGKTLVLTLSLAIAMFPPVSLIGPLFDLWRTLGLYDTWPGLIIPYMSFTLPLAIWTLSAFFREIPWEMEQAAQVDGATQMQAFRRVIVPLAAPGVFTAAILVFFFAWNDFLFAISLTSSDAARTVPAALAFFSGDSQFESPTGPTAAAAVVVTVPIVILVLIFQRRIVAGLTAGAVKG